MLNTKPICKLLKSIIHNTFALTTWESVREFLNLLRPYCALKVGKKLLGFTKFPTKVSDELYASNCFGNFPAKWKLDIGEMKHYCRLKCKAKGKFAVMTIIRMDCMYWLDLVRANTKLRTVSIDYYMLYSKYSSLIRLGQEFVSVLLIKFRYLH